MDTLAIVEMAFGIADKFPIGTAGTQDELEVPDCQGQARGLVIGALSPCGTDSGVFALGGGCPALVPILPSCCFRLVCAHLKAGGRADSIPLPLRALY